MTREQRVDHSPAPSVRAPQGQRGPQRRATSACVRPSSAAAARAVAKQRRYRGVPAVRPGFPARCPPETQTSGPCTPPGSPTARTPAHARENLSQARKQRTQRTRLAWKCRCSVSFRPGVTYCSLARQCARSHSRVMRGCIVHRARRARRARGGRLLGRASTRYFYYASVCAMRTRGLTERGGESPLVPGSQYARAADGGTVIPGSRRADGSLRKEIRVRTGYVAQEEVAPYRPPGALARDRPTAAVRPAAAPRADDETRLAAALAAVSLARRPPPPAVEPPVAPLESLPNRVRALRKKLRLLDAALESDPASAERRSRRQTVVTELQAAEAALAPQLSSSEQAPRSS